MAEVITMDAPPTPASVIADAAGEAGKYNHTGEMISSRMQGLVKGAGFVTGNQPLTDGTDIAIRSHQASLDLRVATNRGYTNKSSVVKGMSRDFLGNFGYLRAALSAPSVYEQLQGLIGSSQLGKSFTAGNLGIGSIYALAPFDVRAPSRLMYPRDTLLLTNFPRPPGQGTSMPQNGFTALP